MRRPAACRTSGAPAEEAGTFELRTAQLKLQASGEQRNKHATTCTVVHSQKHTQPTCYQQRLQRAQHKGKGGGVAARISQGVQQLQQLAPWALHLACGHGWQAAAGEMAGPWRCPQVPKEHAVTGRHSDA